MNEEIDIIELLKRVKEGKAPKEIEIDGEKFILKDLENPPIEYLYYREDYDGYVLNWLENVDVFCNTKIKILDKPIIEELKEIQYSELKYSNIEQEAINSFIVSNRDKINEIIKWINNKE